MLKDYPDHHDAELVIKLYELRREATMREARAAISSFWPKTIDDIKPVLDGKHPLNSAFRQVGSYWEMVYGMARHRIIDPEFLMDSNGEGLFLYAKVVPFLAELRTVGSPRQFFNAQWVVTETEAGKEAFARINAYVQKVLATK